jgi:pyridoxine 5-phosphate synthase
VSDLRLGVNIDHVATLRQQREEDYPSLVDAARVCLESGADQITIHLREDRRHIQDTDVSAIKLVTERYGRPLNLEMGCADDIVGVAIETRPDWICLVPEKREEKTTEGGLNLLDKKQFEKIKRTIETFRENIPETKVSLFVESKQEILEKSVELKADAVEIHTGDYARAILFGNDYSEYIDSFKKGKEYIESKGLGYHAGHGLTDKSLVPLVQEGLFIEYNIGHWIICQSVFDGLSKTIDTLAKIMKK